MRHFPEPVKKLFVPDKPEAPKPLPSPEEDKAAADKAANEAQRKARAALAAQDRGGRRSSLLAAMPAAQAGIQSKRRTLLGGS